MTAAEMAFATASEIADRVRRGALTAVAVTEAHLERIGRLQPKLNCFTTILAEQALAQARELDARRAAGHPLGPLAGVPVAIKDLVDVAGTVTTAGAHRRFHRRAVSDAGLTARLRAADAVVIGKTGLHEFAYGVTNANPHFGPVRNAWNPARIPGGSSGGSAAAVSAGLCAGAVGTDTGGSIRIPASLCGVVGLKPTYGQIPLDGVIPLSWSLDHAGPLARTVADAALLYRVMAVGAFPAAASGTGGSQETASANWTAWWHGASGADDGAGADDGLGAAAGSGDLGGLRVGVMRAFFWEHVDPGVAALAEAALDLLAGLGARPVECALPYASYAGAAAAVIMSAEAAAYHEERLREAPEAFGADVRIRLERGLFLRGTDLVTALRARRFLRRAYVAAFQEADVIVTPTTPVAAAPVEEDRGAAAEGSLVLSAQLTRFTNPFNLTGLPALSVPCGFTSDGLPAGLQIIGPAGGEARVLRVGAAYEQAAGWVRRRPPL